VASSADLLAVDAEVVERLSAPAENELQNVVKLFKERSSGTEISRATSGLTFNNTTRRVRRSQQDGVGMNLHYPSRPPTFRRSPWPGPWPK